MTTTEQGCICSVAGLCPLANKRVTDKQIKKCQTSPYFRACMRKEVALPTLSISTSLEISPTTRVKKKRRWRGLGDVIADGAKLLGIRPCGGCQKRRQKLNKLIPFSRNNKPNQRRKRDYMLWSYGITTVPERLNELFPRTLKSLRSAGFDKPRIFVDGAENDEAYRRFDLAVTVRHPKIRTYGNWVLALGELYLREPDADRYAIFQDDFVTYHNLRQYLEQTPYPDKGYLNLYTFPKNQELAPLGYRGFYIANQRGLGAVALVFSRDAVQILLKHQHMIDRPTTLDERSFKAVDGAIVSSMNKAGWKEYVHTPSLVQHTGMRSTAGNAKHPIAKTFLGEEFDALDLLVS